MGSFKSKEKAFEKKLRVFVENLGGKCAKWHSPGCRGLPDRIVLLPGGRVYFVEMKDEGLKPAPLQLWWLKTLSDLGFYAICINSEDGLTRFMDKLNEDMKNG